LSRARPHDLGGVAGSQPEDAVLGQLLPPRPAWVHGVGQAYVAESRFHPLLGRRRLVSPALRRDSARLHRPYTRRRSCAPPAETPTLGGRRSTVAKAPTPCAGRRGRGEQWERDDHRSPSQSNHSLLSPASRWCVRVSPRTGSSWSRR